MSIADRAAQGAEIPERVKASPDEWYYNPSARKYIRRPSPTEGVTGATKATKAGTKFHTDQAKIDRKSGEWDEVASAITDESGKPIEVPYETDLKTGQPKAGVETQVAKPDAVSYSRSEIMDYKPTGRPIAKDRQEFIRFIKAFEKRTGKLPDRIVVKRYDPVTEKLVGEEIYTPSDFLLWLKP
jgi:hypothetical protein